ncbi:MAG: hypothetical protein CVV05_00190 [Gammaproteobacteria bacterium HGW-Gammaproteobacteria-1]|jgi:hypothetical protein|nr:MAG: hypothetical protein CVV05_00190 [Gammaproteobacteria bacterium HGW-Gammaproteobacteria-1]
MKYALLKTAAIASSGLLKVDPARLVAMVAKDISNVAWAYHDHHKKQIVAMVPLQSIIPESRPGQHAEKDWEFPVVEATERWSTVAYKGKDGVLRTDSMPCVLSRPEGHCVGRLQLTLTGFAAGLVSPWDRYSEYFPDYASAERWCSLYLAANYHREEGFFPPAFIPSAADYPHAVADSGMYKHRGREEAYGLPAGHVIRLESPLNVEVLRQEMAIERAARRSARLKGEPPPMNLSRDPAATPTESQKAESFEWLREISISQFHGAEHAAVMLYEIAHLNAEARSLRRATKPVLVSQSDANPYRAVESTNQAGLPTPMSPDPAATPTGAQKSAAFEWLRKMSTTPFDCAELAAVMLWEVVHLNEEVQRLRRVANPVRVSP